MKKFKIGLIREEKIPYDNRAAFSPQQCSELKNKFPMADIVVQPSPHRCFKDDEYVKSGIEVKEDLSECDLLIGIKEVPVQFLIAGKSYLFFSHTIKKQPHNRYLLQAVLAKNIKLIDYECITGENGERLIGFGHFAGVVGAHNGWLTWGKRYGLFNLKPAYNCFDYNELTEQYRHITLPPIKIAVTGTGRVGKGAAEFLNRLNIKSVTPAQLLQETVNKPVFAVFASKDLYRNKLTNDFSHNEFHQYPERYESVFLPYTAVTDMVINTIFWSPFMAQLFTKADMKSPSFKPKVIADISCDINGSIPTTIRYTTIENPVFGYNPQTEKEGMPYSKECIAIMAVSNLPNELPREASIEFGNNLIQKIMGEFFKPHSVIIERATIAENGRLTPDFEYLTDYALTAE